MRTCSSPFCNNPVSGLSSVDFCDACKEEHSPAVLRVQVEHGKLIRDVLFDAKIFRSAQGMADYIGISFVSLYNWVEKYFGITYQEFKRRYICRSTKCYRLDIRRSNYKRSDYILKKLRGVGRCACVNVPQSNVIMTNASKSEIIQIFKGSPEVKEVETGLFMLAPLAIHCRKTDPLHIKSCRPIHICREVMPIHVKN